MTVVQTVLVFAGIPLGVVLLIAAATLAPSMVRGQVRYRPGRPWDYATAWWLPQSAGSTSNSGHGAPPGRAALTAGPGAHAATDGEHAAASAAVGGASGEW